MKAFEHYNARSIDQALSLAKDYAGQARFIAGGTDLLGVLKDDPPTIPGCDYQYQDHSGSG